MDGGGELKDYLRVKVGDIVETKISGNRGTAGKPLWYQIVSNGKFYPGQVYFGRIFPMGKEEIAVCVHKDYARLIYATAE